MSLKDLFFNGARRVVIRELASLKQKVHLAPLEGGWKICLGGGGGAFQEEPPIETRAYWILVISRTR